MSGRSGILLVILDHVIITHRWFFCCIFTVFTFISSKPQKVWGSIVNLLLYKFSASCCLLVYPVGVTTYWHYFLWRIANILANVYRILTNLGSKICFYTTFLCTKFQGNPTIHFCLMVTLTSLQKQETRPIFRSSYLRNSWCNLVKILNVVCGQWRASPQQKSSSFVQAARSYVCIKTLLFFLSIHWNVWHAGFLGRTTHYHVSWFT